MPNSNPTSTTASGANTPTTRFTGTAETLEDVLKTQTVGLVHLSEFKKRRVELLEQKEREAAERGRIIPGTGDSATVSGTGTPLDSGSETGNTSKLSSQPPKKKRKSAGVNKGKLSFANDDEDDPTSTDGTASNADTPPPPNNITANSKDPSPSKDSTPEPSSSSTGPILKKPKPNPLLPHPPPKALTKSSLLRDFQERELLRREFMRLQELIKNEEIIIPFVFYDGTNVTPREPGVKVKKGEAVWLFLERARRMSGRREWLRVSVDDLLLVRGEVIIPHHYEFYYFLVNKTEGPNGLLFNYPSPLETNPPPPGSLLGESKDGSTPPPLPPPPPPVLGSEDPTMTKVVDRRWYERNKHIFPASVWTNFDPTKDYKGMVRRDRDNNAFFFG